MKNEVVINVGMYQAEAWRNHPKASLSSPSQLSALPLHLRCHCHLLTPCWPTVVGEEGAGGKAATDDGEATANERGYGGEWEEEAVARERKRPLPPSRSHSFPLSSRSPFLWEVFHLGHLQRGENTREGKPWLYHLTPLTHALTGQLIPPKTHRGEEICTRIYLLEIKKYRNTVFIFNPQFWGTIEHSLTVIRCKHTALKQKIDLWTTNRKKLRAIQQEDNFNKTWKVTFLKQPLQKACS